MAAVPPFDYESALLACARGDQNAFQSLYQHEAPRMLALSTRMLPQRAAAEELVRDAFVLIWKNAESYDPGLSTARAWMYSIMRYRALNRLRQAGRMRSGETQWTDALPDTRSAANVNTSNGLAHAISTLDENQRKPLLMAFYNGYTYEQMASRLKVPAQQLKARVHAGLKRLQELSQA